MSVPEPDDLEVDVLVSRVDDLVQKIERDIAEGNYPPGTALPALIDVTVFQLVGCDDPEEAFRHFLTDLLGQFQSVLDMPDEEP